MSTQGIYRFALIFILIFASLSFVSAVRINEVMPHTNSSLKHEWVELYNPTNETINLTNWKIGDLQNNKSFNLTINPYNYSLIVDNNVNFSNFSGCQAVYSLLNNSNFSCFEVSIIGQGGGGYGLDDENDTVVLYDNNSILISNFSWASKLNYNGNSWQFYNNSWQNCTPTPGRENYCWQNTTNSTTNNTTTQNTATNTSNPNQTEEIIISLDYDSEIYNDEEFEVELTAENLENYDYDAKIYIEYDEKTISQIYDEKDDKWKSGTYYVYNILSGSGEDSNRFSLRLGKEWENFTGEAKIYARIRKSSSSSYEEESDTIKFIKKAEEIIRINNATNNIISIKTTQLENVEIIKIGKDIKTYKSKSQYIKEYSLFGFTFLLAVVLAVLMIKWIKLMQ